LRSGRSGEKLLPRKGTRGKARETKRKRERERERKGKLKRRKRGTIKAGGEGKREWEEGGKEGDRAA